MSVAEADAAEAKAKAAGVEKVLMTALWDGVLLPVLAIGGQIAEIGAGAGYWVAATFGTAVARGVRGGLELAMIGAAAYRVFTTILEVEVGA